MSKLIDLTGRRFGRLLVKERQGSDSWKSALWLCLCDCGNECLVSSHNLRTSHTQSCGCLQKEATSKANTTHGHRHTRIYGIWNAMIARCHRKNTKAYPMYGGRGITVCNEWKNGFQAFYDWAMANGYDDDLSIDRIDNDKGYSPDNCRWVSVDTQANNKRSNISVEYNGETHTLAEWAKALGIKYATLRKRLMGGWSVEEAFNTKEVVK